MWIKSNVLFVISIFFVLFNVPPALYAQPSLTFSSADNAEILNNVEKILLQAYAQIGIEISIHSMPVKRALRSSNTGETDGEAFRIAEIEQEYLNRIQTWT